MILFWELSELLSTMLEKVELTGLDNTLDIRKEGKREIKDNSQIFGLKLWFYRDGEDLRF